MKTKHFIYIKCNWSKRALQRTSHRHIQELPMQLRNYIFPHEILISVYAVDEFHSLNSNGTKELCDVLSDRKLTHIRNWRCFLPKIENAAIHSYILYAKDVLYCSFGYEFIEVYARCYNKTQWMTKTKNKLLLLCNIKRVRFSHECAFDMCVSEWIKIWDLDPFQRYAYGIARCVYCESTFNSHK